MKSIGEKLRDTRKSNKYTQEEIAEHLNTSQTMIWRYETDLVPIPITKLKKLCTLYKVSADYILGLPKGLNYPGR